MPTASRAPVCGRVRCGRTAVVVGDRRLAGTSRAEVEGDRPTAVLGVEAAAPRAGARGTDGAAATTATEARGEPGSGETITLAFAGDTGLAGDAGAAASAAFDALRDHVGLAAEAAAG